MRLSVRTKSTKQQSALLSNIQKHQNAQASIIF